MTAEAVDVRAHPLGASLAVRTRPGARRTAVLGERQGALLVSVTAAAEKGRANKALLTFLAGALGVTRSDLQLVAGHGHRAKVVVVEGLAADELRRRLDDLLRAAGETA